MGRSQHTASLQLHGGAHGGLPEHLSNSMEVPCWDPGPPRRAQKLEDTRDGAFQTIPISTRGLGGDDAGVASTPESPATLPTPSASPESWPQHSQRPSRAGEKQQWE